MSIEKLKAELTDAVENRGLRNIGVTWAPEAADLSPDERAAAVLEMLEETKVWDAKPDEEKMRIQIRQAYEYLSNVIGLCQTNVREPFDIKEACRRSEIFGGIEGAMMLLGNWIEQGDRRAIRASRPPVSNGDRQ